MYEKYKIYIIAAGVVIALFAGWYLFGYVPDQRDRTDSIRSELESVSDSQQSAIDRLGNIENGLSDSEATTDRITDRVSETQRSIERTQDRIDISQGRLTTSAEIIADCQRIAKNVRERGQTGTK